MATEHTADWLTKEGMIYSETDATGRTIATCKEQDDAELIVKAVNCHDQLLDACKFARLCAKGPITGMSVNEAALKVRQLLKDAIDSAEPF